MVEMAKERQVAATTLSCHRQNDNEKKLQSTIKKVKVKVKSGHIIVRSSLA